MYRDEDAAKNRYIYSSKGGITRLPSGLTSRSLWLPVEPFKRWVQSYYELSHRKRIKISIVN